MNLLVLAQPKCHLPVYEPAWCLRNQSNVIVDLRLRGTSMFGFEKRCPFFLDEGAGFGLRLASFVGASADDFVQYAFCFSSAIDYAFCLDLFPFSSSSTTILELILVKLVVGGC